MRQRDRPFEWKESLLTIVRMIDTFSNSIPIFSITFASEKVEVTFKKRMLMNIEKDI